MIKPNYKDGSLVNLMSSISKALGGKPKYKPLKILPPKEISKSKNVVLLVIDGLGYEYLKKKGKKSELYKHLKGQMTSVFPSTTATAITTFITGLPAQQSAMTGWFMHLKELGAVSLLLPYVTRAGSMPIIADPKKLIPAKPFSNQFKTQSYIIFSEEIFDTEFTITLAGKSKIIPHLNLKDMFKQIELLVKKRSKKFVYAYWSNLDNYEHSYGPKSKIVYEHFQEIDKEFSKFIKKIKGTNTKLIITADHGQLDVSSKKTIQLKDHPKLEETLTLPLCGEARATYCYVHPAKTKQFENYVKTKLKKYCTLHKSSDLLKQNFFGLYKEHKKLHDRIGDYTLIMKDNYRIKDLLEGERRSIHKGDHGGVSKEEMLVPLITLDL